MSQVFDIEEELKKLPARPGVYLMHNSLDEIIYVGKAVKLKNRVRQYFQGPRGKSVKILKMVENIAWFEYIVTDSETEALMLECNLIKEYRPRYNTMLTDDKGYPYIRVTVEEEFPRVFKVNQMKKDRSRYFGPYTSHSAVKDTLELLQKLFPLRSCRRVLPRDIGKERPCLNYHMGRCMAPCQGLISREDYAKNVEQVLRFLSGDTKEIIRDLTKRMQEASQELNFEEAIRLRDLLDSVKQVAEKQKITDTGETFDRDVIACAIEGTEAIVQVFFMRDGKMLGRDHFHMECEEGTARAEILENFVKQFYSGTPFIPGELLLQEEIGDQLAIGAWLSELRGRKVSVSVPKRGEKERMLELAEKNAQMVLDRDRDKIRREELRTRGAVREIESWLGLAELHRMEAYDISNISGFESVGSMVVFEDGKPKKNDYRKFRIRTVSGPDDYASMAEVLSRRLRHEKLPDLLLMDGGKGQVHAAEKVLSDAGVSIPVCGMVKDDRHNTRGLYFHDTEIPIDRHSEGFHLITRIQDEAHRFAITYHRGLHTKNSIKSVLSEIPGVGPAREKALIRTFSDMEEMKKASVEALAAIDGFNRPAAEKVYAFLHPEASAEPGPDVKETGEKREDAD
ncbi:MAG: excinuclease ABC subunit UvrC [Lachnospiraceae bacterium]|nr:excinuclease ABC subunit UvrC [Lachnospiraceae bacterium]